MSIVNLDNISWKTVTPCFEVVRACRRDLAVDSAVSKPEPVGSTGEVLEEPTDRGVCNRLKLNRADTESKAS